MTRNWILEDTEYLLEFLRLSLLFISSHLLHQCLQGLCQPPGLSSSILFVSRFKDQDKKGSHCFCMGTDGTVLQSMISSIGILIRNRQTAFCVLNLSKDLLVSVRSKFLQRDWKLSFSLLNSAEVYTLLAHTWSTPTSQHQWKKRDERDLGNGHLHIVHPFSHLGVPETQFRQTWLDLFHEQMLTQVTWYRTPLWWNHNSPAKKSSLVSFRNRPLSI